MMFISILEFCRHYYWFQTLSRHRIDAPNRTVNYINSSQYGLQQVNAATRTANYLSGYQCCVNVLRNVIVLRIFCFVTVGSIISIFQIVERIVSDVFNVGNNTI